MSRLMHTLMPILIEEGGAIRAVLREFGLATEPRRIIRNTVGLVNETFVVELDDETFVLRRLNSGTPPSQLSLGMEVLRYLEARKYELSPRIIANTRGEQLTYHAGDIYMLQQFIPGETRVTMDDVTQFEGAALRSFFETVAEFSKITSDFAPSKVYPQSALSDYPRKMPMVLENVGKGLPTSVKSIFEKRKHAMVDFASRALDELIALNYDKLPKQLVHFDFHPGNVHYFGEKVVGIFDYDTVRFDCRLSELAGAIAMSCHGRRGDALLKRKVQEGLLAYRSAYGPSEFDPEMENRLLKAATEASIVAQALWAVDWYCENYQRDNARTVLGHWINLCVTDCRSLFC
jgi:aminoglycoside phosphotransferase (APT) family kinase protein